MVILNHMLKGFKDFILRGNVLDLAVAFIMGAAFNEVVKALVNSILMPGIWRYQGWRIPDRCCQLPAGCCCPVLRGSDAYEDTQRKGQQEKG